MNKDALICEVCGAAYMPYGTQNNPEPNCVDLTFLFSNGKGLQKIKRYKVCDMCMYAVRNFLEGNIDAENMA